MRKYCKKLKTTACKLVADSPWARPKTGTTRVAI